MLAWPLFVWNFFNWKPLSWWLVIGCVQTFVLIPLIVRRWGKGAYCGWICSCGALAETMGDTQRQKMPHGPAWNRVNLVGQAILAICLLCCSPRASSPGRRRIPRSAQQLGTLYDALFYSHAVYDYYHVVDMFLAGIVGVGIYFWFSGRVWCRFACPLAALMHIYARFSRFRIFADKKKCISCNVCTSVCHQGIDIMSFANKGLPMEDPECVRCSACVQSCPTGTLQFGRVGTRRRAGVRPGGGVAGADGRGRRRQEAAARDGVAARGYVTIAYVLILYVKALHVIFMVTWFAALFYLPRLFVYHAMTTDAATSERFKVMERKLAVMMDIGATLTMVFGFWLLFSYGWASTSTTAGCT